MNTELFIARRLNSTKGTQDNFSKPMVKIAIIGIALGLAVMILSVAIVTGFKTEIRNKVIGFGAHVQIVNFDANTSFETNPLNKNQDFYPDIKKIDGIKHIQVYATKAGIIKANEEIQGVVLKGIDSCFDWQFFDQYIVAGEKFNVTDSATSNSLVISKSIASLLKLDVGDEIAMFFIQKPPRMRRFVITGIYETNLEEFDKLFVLGDIKHVQKLNNWSEEQVSGFEVTIDDFAELDEMTGLVYDQAGYSFQDDGTKLRVLNIKEKYPQLFDWLKLLDINVLIILILMVAVAGVNMISALLILILERTNMIGILKAVGAENKIIQKIFLYQSFFIVTKGLFWGNLIGIALCLLQYYFGIITLDPASYYITVVPININILTLLLLNIGTLMVTIIILLLPTMVISKINPEKTIRFD